MSPRVIELLGKPECCLCEEALEVLERLRDELDFELVELDITRDEALHRRYFESIPVVLLDGRELMHFQIDEPLLRERLRASDGLGSDA